jgi:eukaryotic-like serine/threonine-protein kinase
VPGGPPYHGTVLRACLAEEELFALVFEPGAGSGTEALAHLERCAPCRARHAELVRDAALFGELRAVARRPPGPPRVPGYTVTAELRRGGQGTVYTAVQESTQRVVALKVLSARAALSARERRRFEREVELGSRLAHPGIVTVFDSGLADGIPWYAMELVDGETLDAFVARTETPLAGRLALFLELCAAVAHAHRSGVIHRDLKPGNVLVDEAGRVRVLDFGTALPLAAGRLTAPGEFLGTLAYASPEQVSGGAEACDTRTDVYSLGVVLYELVTGALPIDTAGSLSEVVERILRAPPEPPARHVPGLDADLAAVLAGALEKERERRYPSVEALARDVEHFLAHEPLEVRPRRTRDVLAKALRRHRRAVLVAGAVALGAGALGFALVRERLAARRADENAVLVRAVFQDILGAAAPGRMGGEAPLREVLALAAREIEQTLEEAPDAQAAVQLTIGDTYRRLLMPAEAESHLRAALARFRALDEGGLETAHCLDLLGQVLSSLGSPEAIPVQEEALALRRARLADDDALVAASERGLAQALLAQVRDSDVARAHALLESALAKQRATLGDDDPEAAETRMVLARVARWRDEPSVAETLLASALETFASHAREGEIDPRRIECLAESAAFLQAHKRYDEAEELLAQAEELTRALYGDERTSDLLRRHAQIASARGELASAEELTRRAVAFELGLWAASRPDDRAAIDAAAAALDDEAGRDDPQGSGALVGAFRLLRRFRGDGSFELAGWLNATAKLCEARARPLEAEALLIEALEIRCRAWGASCPVRGGTLLALAELYARTERPAEARAAAEQGLAIADEHGDSSDSARARAVLASLAAPEERP